MSPKQKQIDNLKTIYKQETGKTLTDAEASEMATRLQKLFSILVESESQ